MNLIKRALGADWDTLPTALQEHYPDHASVDTGTLDVDYPGWMQWPLTILHRVGALIDRRGRSIATRVEKSPIGDRLHWRRILSFPDGRTVRFESVWEPGPDGHVIEYINPWLGLEMAPYTRGEILHYQGQRYVFKWRGRPFTLPKWLTPGQASIVERAIDRHRFEMDFRLTHPLFGEIFRYGGRFESGPMGPAA